MGGFLGAADHPLEGLGHAGDGEDVVSSSELQVAFIESVEELEISFVVRVVGFEVLVYL